jgi:hypothetical protein
MTQLSLDSYRPHRFDGPAYVPERDDARLSGQIERVYRLMRDGEWRTLDEIARATGDPQASVSAQLRHLRKARFGGHRVDREYDGAGLHRYRLIPNLRPA